MHSFSLDGIQLCLEFREMVGVWFLHADPAGGPLRDSRRSSASFMEVDGTRLHRRGGKCVIAWAVPCTNSVSRASQAHWMERFACIIGTLRVLLLS